MPAIEHAYRDRWQTSLREAWEADRATRDDTSFSRLLALLEERDRELEAHLRATTSTTPWVAPTLLNSWVNYATSSQAAEYRRVGDRVEVRGFIKNGTVPAAVFTLPEGFRPPNELTFATAATAAYGQITVAASGSVSVVVGTNTYVAINFSFSVVTT